MPEDGNWSEITILKEELEASLEMYASLKKENQGLRQEIDRLKSQISSLKPHDNERKSLLWKIHHQNSPDLDKKSPPLPKLTDESLRESTSSRVLGSACLANREKGEAEPPPMPIDKTDSFSPANRRPPSPPGAALAPPPPPPPPIALVGAKALRCVPEVIELYLSAIKTAVERQGSFIDVLIKQVESAAFGDISGVEAFVKWLDGELVSLVDERAVLKHFPRWPESKADALREAAFSYRDMANLGSEVASFLDDPKEPYCSALRRIQVLQDRLEQRVDNVESLREVTNKRYRDFQIPWQWMLETGLVGQMRLSSLRLAEAHMKRVVGELLRCTERPREDDHVMLQGIRFAHRAHQFLGGFDKEAVQSFEGLKKAIIDSGR